MLKISKNIGINFYSEGEIKECDMEYLGIYISFVKMESSKLIDYSPNM
jgi:hypothetical protein